LSYDDRYVLEDGHWRFASRKLGIWYREIGGVRAIGSGNSAVPSLPDALTEWQVFDLAKNA